jgi:hypothetical protein
MEHLRSVRPSVPAPSAGAVTSGHDVNPGTPVWRAAVVLRDAAISFRRARRPALGLRFVTKGTTANRPCGIRNDRHETRGLAARVGLPAPVRGRTIQTALSLDPFMFFIITLKHCILAPIGGLTAVFTNKVDASGFYFSRHAVDRPTEARDVAGIAPFHIGRSDRAPIAATMRTHRITKC